VEQEKTEQEKGGARSLGIWGTVSGAQREKVAPFAVVTSREGAVPKGQARTHLALLARKEEFRASRGGLKSAVQKAPNYGAFSGFWSGPRAVPKSQARTHLALLARKEEFRASRGGLKSAVQKAPNYGAFSGVWPGPRALARW
jgi:hypothetical protein